MSIRTETGGPFDVKTEDLIHINVEEVVNLLLQLLVIEAIKAVYDMHTSQHKFEHYFKSFCCSQLNSSPLESSPTLCSTF
jgi:hypothetical protein